jgi:sensor histidine kinase YesM
MMVMKDQEMQAQTLALQSQMNPFFLYSSLATMSEMLDQGKTDQVSAMCRDVMSILHYINSNDEERSSIRDEIAQVKRFYSCLKRHHGKNLSIECNVEPLILECRVPKLCVQFLVENAVQSVLKVDPPWKILVKGERQDNNWVITVYDNGPGFDSEAAKEMQRDMAGILTTGILPSLQTGDIGILNIFIRLYLLDGVPFIFEFGNREEGGAFVKAGGVIKNDK